MDSYAVYAQQPLQMSASSELHMRRIHTIALRGPCALHVPPKFPRPMEISGPDLVHSSLDSHKCAPNSSAYHGPHCMQRQ